MTKNGFTLIELLAVIAILAIILLVAVPTIIDLINKSKLSIYKVDESMMEKAAANYLASNENLIPKTTGETTTITLTDLKNSGYISPVTDLANTSECTDSKVYITKQADNSLQYETGLICSNYISIDTFDLLNGIGKFETDTNLDGLANGWTNAGANTFSITNGVQKYTPTTQWGCIVKDGFSITVGQIFYGVAWVKSSSTSTAIQTGDGDGNAAGIQWHTGSNIFEFQSARFTVTADNSANGIRVRSWLTSGWTPIEIKDVYYFNLTAIYGVGNEPTEAQMDALILKSK